MRRVMFLAIVGLLAMPALAGAQSGKPAFQRGYLHPQLVQDGRGNAGMLWVKLSSAGHDLFLAKRLANGAMQDPVKVNPGNGDVLYSPSVEARPGLAAGPGSVVGVSWYDPSGRLFVAVSRDGARSFTRAVEVDPGFADSSHPYSDVAFDSNGTLYVAWISTREGVPSLLVARLDQDRNPVVQNLTSEFGTRVCSGSRPDLFIRGRDLTISFRVADEEGYRDVHRIRTGADLKPVKPERLGPPRWKLDGCPTNGAATSGEFTWFIDGSGGQMQLMEAYSSTAAPTPVTAASVDGAHGPRLIAGSEGPAWMLYLPGRTYGQVLVRKGGGWRVLVAEVPYFCSDITLLEGQLLMVGDKEGTLWMEAAAVN